MKTKISVIIPCYNEEDTISACLNCLENQTVEPLEIIIIDNNCTDKTVEMAKKYHVKIIKEPEQGLIAARNTGFAVAKGDIIAKLDADSMPHPTWLASITKVMQKQSVQAVTGTGYFYDAPCKKLVKAYRNFFVVWLNRTVLRHHMLWGSNLAIRRSAWNEISDSCCSVRNIMEDLDLAIHLAHRYGTKSIVYRPSVKVDISARRNMVSMKRNWLYLKMWPVTLKLHGYQRRVVLWPTIAFLLFSMSAVSKITRFYSYKEDKMIFSLSQWRSVSLYNRDNP